MRQPSFAPYALGASAALVLGFLAYGPGLGFEGLGLAPSEVDEPVQSHDGVLILVVSDVNDLFALRAAIEPERIVSDSEQAFAVREGRIVTTSLEAAGAPLSQLGWADRALEIRILGSLRRSEGSRRGGTPPPDGSLAALARKPTLTIGEAIGAINRLR